MESENEVEKSGKFNHKRDKKCCRYHQTNGHLVKQCFHQMGNRKNSKMECRKNGLTCTIARVIQIKNVSSSRAAANVRTVLLLMAKIAKKVKTML